VFLIAYIFSKHSWVVRLQHFLNLILCNFLPSYRDEERESEREREREREMSSKVHQEEVTTDCILAVL
jgi:hypothetical protein